MKIVYLAAGAAGSFCGACARDVTLARTLIARGHDVLLLPLYTPLMVDGPDPSYSRVFYGGISAYLEQKHALFRRRLPLLDRLLGSRWLLRLVSRLALATRPEDLGEMTVSVLRGTAGRQAKELEELIDFLEHRHRPDVVSITNSLLSAIAPEVKRRLNVPVVCALQGEESFIVRLLEPHASRALELMRRHAESVDVYVTPSADYADEMAGLLGVPVERFRVVRPGIDLEAYRPTDTAAVTEVPPSVGCLSRISAVKGTDLLCRAFAEVHQRRPGRSTLSLAGQLFPHERRWWRQVRRDLESATAEPLDYRGTLDHDQKLAFLQSLSVFVQPSRQVERRGMAALEAMAVGVPVVVPRAGIFPEVIELTGGGILTEPEDVDSIAEAIVHLVDHPEERQRLAEAARAGIQQHFSARAMADQTLTVYRDLRRGTPVGE